MAADGLMMGEVRVSGLASWPRDDRRLAGIHVADVATTDVPMAVVDATIRLKGVDLVELTSFDDGRHPAERSEDVRIAAQKYLARRLSRGR
jgi:hypothetical protein